MLGIKLVIGEKIIMDDLFVVLFFRNIIRFLGKYARYFWFSLIGSPKSLKSLTNRMKNDYADMGNAMKQDFLNAVVGAVVFFILTFIIVAIVFHNRS